MVPRVERAAKVVGELQAKVDRLEATRPRVPHEPRPRHRRARPRSLARARAPRCAPRAPQRARAGDRARGDPEPSRPSLAGGAGRDGAARAVAARQDPRAWEVEALIAEEKRAATVDMDLAFQLDALQKQLDAKNEEFEREPRPGDGPARGLALGASPPHVGDRPHDRRRGVGPAGRGKTPLNRRPTDEQPAEAAGLRGVDVGVAAQEAEVRTLIAACAMSGPRRLPVARKSEPKRNPITVAQPAQTQRTRPRI